MLVRVNIPDDLRGCPWYNSICRPHRVCVSVAGYGRNRDELRSGEYVRKVPAEGDQLAWCNLVEGGQRLRWLGDGEQASWGGWWDDEPGAGRGSWRVGSVRWLIISSVRGRVIARAVARVGLLASGLILRHFGGELGSGR